ncbi:MAG: DUF3006 domain-containing protein [Candidatus Bathyarchaeia archaeon]
MGTTVKATIDRIEGELAVAYSDEDENVYHIPLNKALGLKEGVRVTLTLRNGEVSKVKIEEEETEAAKRRLAKLMRKLVKKTRKSRKSTRGSRETSKSDFT